MFECIFLMVSWFSIAFFFQCSRKQKKNEPIVLTAAHKCHQKPFSVKFCVLSLNCTKITNIVQISFFLLPCLFFFFYLDQLGFFPHLRCGLVCPLCLFLPPIISKQWEVRKALGLTRSLRIFMHHQDG